MNGLQQYGEVTLRIGNYNVDGVQSFDYSDSSERIPVRAIGKRFINIKEGAPKSTSLSFSRYDFSNDPFFSGMFNGVPWNGGIIGKNQRLGFESGYFTSYSANGSVGSFPECSYQMDIYGRAGSGISLPNATSSMDLMKIIAPRNISVTCKDSTTNKVKSYSFSLSIPQDPYYCIGHRTPSAVKQQLISASMSFDLEVDDMDVYGAYQTFSAPRLDDVSIVLKDENGSTVKSYNITSADLVNETRKMDVGGTFLASLQYVGFFNPDDNQPVS